MRENPPSPFSAKNDDRISFGKYKSIALKDVPADYLVWCYRQGKLPARVKEYVLHNFEILLAEIDADEAAKQDVNERKYREEKDERGF